MMINEAVFLNGLSLLRTFQNVKNLLLFQKQYFQKKDLQFTVQDISMAFLPALPFLPVPWILTPVDPVGYPILRFFLPSFVVSSILSFLFLPILFGVFEIGNLILPT
ncbi:MAG: hypothetical protein KKF30_04885 [Proteobacteria bacterium]|nr:hypothetical protein [Pseudomonadota bacterium]MBU4470836.1 hypothetical protein [Pseudomonadota bacterium]MCG2750966.1 hypothetical protein [Desulfobacteraceae bacterium]